MGIRNESGLCLNGGKENKWDVLPVDKPQAESIQKIRPKQ